jgi:hypothetical protein
MSTKFALKLCGKIAFVQDMPLRSYYRACLLQFVKLVLNRVHSYVKLLSDLSEAAAGIFMDKIVCCLALRPLRVFVSYNRALLAPIF